MFTGHEGAGDAGYLADDMIRYSEGIRLIWQLSAEEALSSRSGPNCQRGFEEHETGILTEFEPLGSCEQIRVDFSGHPVFLDYVTAAKRARLFECIVRILNKSKWPAYLRFAGKIDWTMKSIQLQFIHVIQHSCCFNSPPG